MINKTLFSKEIKSNWILFVIFIGIIAMYSVMVIALFDPELGDSLRMMAEGMPEVFAAFGMADVGTTMLEFVTGYLYGLILTVFPAVFILILSNRLIAKYVSDGSMAYLLAVPEKRRTIAVTQMFFLNTSLLVMMGFVIVLLIGTCGIMFPGELEIGGLLKINVGLLGLWIFLGGICFLVSCIFNDSKRVSGINAGVVIYAFLIQMIAQTGDKFENLKYATPLTLFQAEGLAEGEGMAWITCAVLYITGVTAMIIGVKVFSKRNLPL